MTRQYDEWDRLFDQKKHNLDEERCQNALRISSLEDLETSLLCMKREYDAEEPTRDGSFFDSLKLTLPHIKSFADAVLLCSRKPPIAGLIWGTVHAVTEAR